MKSYLFVGLLGLVIAGVQLLVACNDQGRDEPPGNGPNLGTKEGRDHEEPSGTGIYQTPEEVFVVFANALQAKNAEAAFGCLTPRARDALVGWMVMDLLMQEVALGTQVEGTPDRATETQVLPEYLKDLSDVVDKYGLREMREVYLEDGEAPASFEVGFKKVAAAISNPNEVVASILALSETIADERVTWVSRRTLEDLKIEGNVATGQQVLTSGKGKLREQALFTKANGGWLIDGWKN